MSTNIWKEKVRNTEKETGEKDRRKKISREISTQEILEMEKSIWKERIRKNVHQKTIELCNRVKRGICTKEEESVFIIKREKRGGTGICGGLTVKGIYSAIKIAIDLTSLFFSKEEWKKKNSTRLLLCKLVDGKEWVPPTPNCRYPRQSRKKEGVHKT